MQIGLRTVLGPVAIGLAALLAGCAGHIKTQTPDVPTRPARSATVRLEIPPTIPIRVSRSSFGAGPPPTIRNPDVEHSRKEVAELVREVRDQLVPAVEAALTSNGIPSGDDTLIHVKVESAWHNGLGPGAVMILSVWYKGDAPRPWQARITAGESVIDNAKTTAAKFSNAVVEALLAEGIVVPAPAR